MTISFQNRAQAGRVLAQQLRRYEGRDDVVVLALPPGGVPVAFEVAQALAAPLDVFVVRSLGLPFAPEVAMGAVASGGVRVLTDAVWQIDVDADDLDDVEQRERAALRESERAWRGAEALLDVAGRTVVLVDDGIAAGTGTLAAVRALRQRKPARIVVAAPVGSAEACAALASQVDELVCTLTLAARAAVGDWYRDFDAVADDQVRALLARSRRGVRRRDGLIDVRIPVENDEELAAVLTIPRMAADPQGLVLLAQTGARDRAAARYVAAELAKAKFATLLVELLTDDEQDPNAEEHVFAWSVDLLTRRLRGALSALQGVTVHHELPHLDRWPLALFGVDRTAAAVLRVAAERSDVRAIVCCGRADLAAGALARVRVPTLLLAGEHDDTALSLQRCALDALPVAELALVRGVAAPWEEWAGLPQVAAHTRDWLEQHLAAAEVRPSP